MPGKRLDTFVAPRPNRLLIGAMTPVNRVVMLKGVPLLRSLPLLGSVPGIRGVANIKRIDVPPEDQARLAAVFGPGKATFVTPNHPEFFTDWMIDKEIVARVAPLAASWATNGIVNGMGRAAQRFWLANNLIAQIPGNSGEARRHSIEWAAKGHGVLLHPEGAVGWHGDWVAPLMPGAAEMALEALERGRAADPSFQYWIAPVVWKLVYQRDVEAGLHRECAYVERRLGLEAASGVDVARRIFGIYDALLARAEEKAGVTTDGRLPFAGRLEALSAVLIGRLSALTGLQDPPGKANKVLRAARRVARQEHCPPAVASEIRTLADDLQRLSRLGPFAWTSERMTQEHAGEHLKRIRNDYCAGTLRDTVNRLVPQPVGPRHAIIRVPEPIGVHALQEDAEALTSRLRQSLQAALDAINAELRRSGGLREYENPFFVPKAAVAPA